jgi:hypothetical protein
MPSSFSYLENTTGENIYWKIASPPLKSASVLLRAKLPSGIKQGQGKKKKNIIDRGYGSKKGA